MAARCCAEVNETQFGRWGEAGVIVQIRQSSAHPLTIRALCPDAG
jgi:hypothetical protein